MCFQLHSYTVTDFVRKSVAETKIALETYKIKPIYATAFPNMESTILTPELVDATTSGHISPNENSKVTGQKTDMSQADLHSSTGGSEHPDKTWKTQTKLSPQDHSTGLPLGGSIVQQFSSFTPFSCQFNPQNKETGNFVRIFFRFQKAL